MTTGAWILVAAVVLALAIGLWRAATDGRFRGTHPVRGATPDGVDRAGPRDETPFGGPDTGEVRVEAPAGAPVALLLADLGQPLGERATLLQFSSAFCAPCRATRRVLGDIAETVPGVAHVEVDAEHHLDAVRRLGIARTPTTLVLDAAGHEASRAAGAPRKEQVLAALGQVIA